VVDAATPPAKRVYRRSNTSHIFGAEPVSVQRVDAEDEYTRALRVVGVVTGRAQGLEDLGVLVRDGRGLFRAGVYVYGESVAAARKIEAGKQATVSCVGAARPAVTTARVRVRLLAVFRFGGDIVPGDRLTVGVRASAVAFARSAPNNDDFQQADDNDDSARHAAVAAL